MNKANNKESIIQDLVSCPSTIIAGKCTSQRSAFTLLCLLFMEATEDAETPVWPRKGKEVPLWALSLPSLSNAYRRLKEQLLHVIYSLAISLWAAIVMRIAPSA